MNDYVSKPIDQRELVNAIVRQSEISMLDMGFVSLSRVVEATPLPAEAEGQINDLMGDLDGLLDGTND